MGGYGRHGHGHGHGLCESVRVWCSCIFFLTLRII